MSLEVQVETPSDGRAVLRASGRLDLLSAGQLRDQIDEVIAGGRALIVLDVSGVPFVDSSGIGAIVGALRRAREAGGELRVAGAGEQMTMVMGLTGVDRVLTAHDSVEDALAAL